MFDEFLRKAAELRSRGESFALATVVRFEGSISGKPGDKAIIYSDGRIWGWIGGGCTQPAVIKEALKALEDGEPRFVRIRPPLKPKSEPKIVDYTMNCQSGGTLDVYIEPVLPDSHLVILGRSLVAQSLVRLGKAIDFSVSVLAPGATREDFPNIDAFHDPLDLHNKARVGPRTYVVVSTQGESDEEALELALGTEANYIAFVASTTKAEKVFDYLRAKGMASEQLSRIHAPAGLKIGAVSPEEIAISILAEIVQVRRSKVRLMSAKAVLIGAKDPVCGMPVESHRATYCSQHNEVMFYFCCDHCKQAFDRNPEKYLAATPALPGNLS
ncbi:MAG: XdhC family protein [Acidobacteriaceae bacterium]|nr:XdhC family protein [Acidobacteriaceae bacterium]